MKKAFNISIARTLFTIEEDAYNTLNSYLESIRAHFSSTEGKDEIISDIESRIAEQFTDMKASIITIDHVNKIIASMGKVEDFDSGDNHNAGASSSETKQDKKNRKLYRNPDGKIFAGVCSGLAKYFDIDALWVRIAFVLLTIFTQGFGILLYIILIIVITEAKTASQKLEMEGSEVTLDTISKNMRDKADEIRSKHGSKFMRLLAIPFTILKRIMDALRRFVGPVFRNVVGVLLVIASILAIVALSVFAPVVLTNSGNYFDFPLETVVSMPHFYFGVIAAYIALVIPLAVIFTAALGMLRRKNFFTAKLGLALLAIWCIAAASAGTAGFNAGVKIDQHISTDPRYDTVIQTLPITENVSNVVVTSGTRMTYVQGSAAEIQLSGRTDALNSVVTKIEAGTLTLDRNRIKASCLFCDQGNVHITITPPTLSSITAKEGARVSASDWKSATPVSFTATEGSRGDVNIFAPKISITADQGSRITLTGSSTKATVFATQGSRIDTVGATSTHMQITAKEGSRVVTERENDEYDF